MTRQPGAERAGSRQGVGCGREARGDDGGAGVGVGVLPAASGPRRVPGARGRYWASSVERRRTGGRSGGAAGRSLLPCCTAALLRCWAAAQSLLHCCPLLAALLPRSPLCLRVPSFPAPAARGQHDGSGRLPLGYSLCCVHAVLVLRHKSKRG